MALIVTDAAIYRNCRFVQEGAGEELPPRLGRWKKSTVLNLFTRATRVYGIHERQSEMGIL